MNTFFTFLLNIHRHPVHHMIRALECLVKSLDYFNNTYELIVYTNVHFTLDNSSVKIIMIDMNTIANYYGDMWHNISYHKLVIATSLTEGGISPIWLDLDTIVCRNIDHLNGYTNFFVKQGGPLDERPFPILPNISVPVFKYIQGNIWKVDGTILTKLMNLWNSMPIKPDYDSQGLFNYAYHFKGLNTEMLSLGEDVDIGTINGLDIVNDSIVMHPDIAHLKDNLVMRNGKIMSISSGKEVQFFSFTFYTLIHFFNNNQFTHFSDPAIVEFFKSCGYAV